MLSIAEQHRRPCHGERRGRSSDQDETAPGDAAGTTAQQDGGHVDGFLDVCADPLYRTIVLELGPSALGPTQWRELDHRYAGRILEELIAGLMADGAIESGPADLLSRLCCATAGEAALQIAGSDDPAETRRQAMQMLTKMFNGLLTD